MEIDPSSRLEQAAFEYENLLLKAGRLVCPDDFYRAESSEQFENNTSEYSREPVRRSSEYQTEHISYSDPYPKDMNDYTFREAKTIHMQGRTTRETTGATSEQFYDHMNTLRAEIERLQGELQATKASAAEETAKYETKLRDVNEEAAQEKDIMIMRLQKLELENTELKRALKESHKQLEIEQREMLKTVALMEKQGHRNSKKLAEN